MGIEIKEELTITAMQGDKMYTVCNTQQIGDFSVLVLDGVPQSHEELYSAFREMVDVMDKFDKFYEAYKAAQ